MSTNTFATKSLVNDMLQDKLSEVETELNGVIQNQVQLYNMAKRQTFNLLIGNSSSAYSLIQHIRYQGTIAGTLRELERTYLEYFGKPWDYEEPVEEPKVEEVAEPTKPTKGKRGRKPKTISI
jgi:hypothetical protein